MSSDCSNLLLLTVMSTSLPAFLVAVTILMSLMVLGRIEGKHAMIIMLICMVAAFTPAIVTWLFGSKLISDKKMASCAASIIKNGMAKGSSSSTRPVPPPPSIEMMRMQQDHVSATGRGGPPPQMEQMHEDMYETDQAPRSGGSFLGAFE